MTLEEIRKLCDQATPGRWREGVSPFRGPFNVFAVGPNSSELCGTMLAQTDAEFTAEARTLMPKLLAVAEAAKAFVPEPRVIQWERREMRLMLALAALGES